LFGCIFLFSFCTLVRGVFALSCSFSRWETWSSPHWCAVYLPVLHRVSCCWAFNADWRLTGSVGKVALSLSCSPLLLRRSPLLVRRFTCEVCFTHPGVSTGVGWTRPFWFTYFRWALPFGAVPDSVQSFGHGTCPKFLQSLPNAACATPPSHEFTTDCSPWPVSVRTLPSCSSLQAQHTLGTTFRTPSTGFSTHLITAGCCFLALHFGAWLTASCFGPTRFTACAFRFIV
jgi:hypothetical protein